MSSSCACHTTDNDGLWTSLVLASELFRYEVTRSSDAQQKILKQFAGIKFLNDVSDVPIDIQDYFVHVGVTGDWHSWANGSISCETKCPSLRWHLVQLNNQTWMEMESRYKLR